MGRAIIVRLALLAASFFLAWLASLYLQSHAEHEDVPDKNPIEARSLTKSTASSGTPLELLTRGDQALRQHRFALALSQFDELRATSADHGPLIEYRLALCNESIGQMDRAIAGYRAAISGPQSPSQQFACHLGLARCLFRQGLCGDARRQLYPFLLDESRQQGAPRTFLADARYLIALSLSREAFESLTPPPGGKGLGEGYENPISTAVVGLETPYYLDEVGTALGKTPAEPAPDPGAAPKEADAGKKTAPRKDVVVKKMTDKNPIVLVQNLVIQRGAAEVFDLLAAESGVTIKLSAGARKSLADRSVRLNVQNWLLDDLLESVADHFDLICWMADEVRHVSTAAEIEANQLKVLRRDWAGRALRGALVAHAGHPWAAAACLELGNWEAVQGKLPEAQGWFERLVREAQNSPFVPPAYFNLALLSLRKQDVVSARSAYFHVVDYAPGHELALQAYIRIGQSYLEEDDAAAGIAHLKHALATAPGSAYHGHAVVALAAGYLLNNQPDKARTALAAERGLLQKSPCKATAAFLDAYAQFQLAKESNPGRREASDLLSTLWRDEDKTVLGPLGDYLLAQAYRDLGFWSQAEKLLRHAVKQSRGSLEKAASCLLADTLLKQQQRAEAEKLLVKVASTPSPYRPRAKLQLAQIRLQDKQFKECVALCRELWNEQSLQPGELLPVWGAALEGTGEFAAAARCFSGKAPD